MKSLFLSKPLNFAIAFSVSGFLKVFSSEKTENVIMFRIFQVAEK